MKTFNITIDETLDKNLYYLKRNLSKTTRVEIFQLAISVLTIAAKGRQQGLKLTLANDEDTVVKEIVLP